MITWMVCCSVVTWGIWYKGSLGSYISIQLQIKPLFASNNSVNITGESLQKSHIIATYLSAPIFPGGRVIGTNM